MSFSCKYPIEAIAPGFCRGLEIEKRAFFRFPLYMGEQDGVVRLWPQRQRSKPYDVWMVPHGDFRHTARIRVVIDALVQAFAGASEG